MLLTGQSGVSAAGPGLLRGTTAVAHGDSSARGTDHGAWLGEQVIFCIVPGQSLFHLLFWGSYMVNVWENISTECQQTPS